MKHCYGLLMVFTIFIINISANPEISIILTVFNKEHQIGKVVQAILNKTKSPFEFIIVYDGCTDRSEKIAHKIVSKNKGSAERIIELAAPNVNETKANNIGMKAASGKYLILLQDDMEMIYPGWEIKLIEPLRLFDDVFAVSARWAGSYKPFLAPAYKQEYSNIARGTQFKDTFAIRDCVCRGPLAFDATVLKELNYFDESYCPLYLDDHDLCIRAYQTLKKRCGFRHVPYRQLQKTVRPSSIMSTGEKFQEVMIKNRQLYCDRYKDHFTSNNHDENRPLNG